MGGGGLHVNGDEEVDLYSVVSVDPLPVQGLGHLFLKPSLVQTRKGEVQVKAIF